MLLSTCITTVVFCHLVSHQYVWSVSQQLLVSLQLGSPMGILALFQPFLAACPIGNWGLLIHIKYRCFRTLSQPLCYVSQCGLQRASYTLLLCAWLCCKDLYTVYTLGLSTVVKLCLYGLFLCEDYSSALCRFPTMNWLLSTFTLWSYLCG